MTDSGEKFKESLAALKHAFEFENKISRDPFYFLGIAKAFETCFEYTWKHFRKKAMEEGVEDIFSPREAIKAAGRFHLIDDVEKWLGFLEDRNEAVHDYLGMSNEDYLKVIKEFFSEAKKIK